MKEIMLAERQFTWNSTASLNPFNSPPRVSSTPLQTSLILPFPTLSASRNGASQTFAVVELSSWLLPSQNPSLSSLATANIPSVIRTLTIESQSGPLATDTPSTSTQTGSLRPSFFSVPGPIIQPSRRPNQNTLTSNLIRPTNAPSARVSSLSMLPLPSVSIVNMPASASPSSIWSNSLTTQSTTSTSTSSSPSSTRTDPTSSSTASSTSTSTKMGMVPAINATARPGMVPQQKSSNLSSGAIAGITIGLAFLTAIIGFLIFFCLKRRNRGRWDPKVYPEEAYLYDPPITPPPPSSIYSSQAPMMRGPQVGYGYAPTAGAASPHLRPRTPEENENDVLLIQQQPNMQLRGSWPASWQSNPYARPLLSPRLSQMPTVHESQTAMDEDPRNPFRDQ